MLVYVIYMIPVLLWLGYSYSTNREITAMEATIQLVGSALVMGLLVFFGYMSAYSDTGIVVGKLTDKTTKTYQCDMTWSRSTSYGCEHYVSKQVYDGQTCTTTNKIRSCSKHYHTEYRHIYPWERNYYVESDVSSSVKIPRADSQGAVEPPRWIEAYIGEPFAAEYRFDNFVRASKASLFNKDARVLDQIEYPSVTDYYKVKMFLNGSYQDNVRLMKELSPTKTIAIVYKAPPGSSESYAEDFAKTLAGHKMYDIAIVIGDSWVNVRSWSKTSIVNVQLRDHILSNRENWIDGVGKIISDYYVKPNPKDFEYLRQEVSFPIWAHIIAMILVMVASPFVTYLFANNNTRK